MTISPSTQWVHTKTGNLYKVIDVTKIKVFDWWFGPVIVYRRVDEEHHTLWLRFERGFLKSFKPKLTK